MNTRLDLNGSSLTFTMSMQTQLTEQSSQGPGRPGRITGSDQTVVRRKLTVKSIETKYQAILAVEKAEMSKSAIAKQFQIPANTLSTWLKSSEKIKEAYLQSSFNPDRKRMRTAKSEDTEKAVLKWFTTAREQNIPVSGPMLLTKAEQFAEQLGDTDFKANTGWLDRFKQRHQICFKKICGEAKSVDQSSDDMQNWTIQLQKILDEYHADDIFNADETGLFFRLLPDKTLEFKGVDCTGGKKSKERLTVLVCSNMSGTEKLPLLVIGKSKNLRCFKNVRTLPTDYLANKKAWMTSDIFKDWLVKLDKKFVRQKRRVAMVVDNCPAHPRVKNLKAITLVFLPPNTTSKTQPMDQGVIQNLKVHYRKRMLLRHVQAIDDNTDLHITVLDALRLLNYAWKSVKPTTISNCFSHSGFKSADITPSDLDEEDDNIPLAQLTKLPVPFDQYTAVDDNVPTSELLTDQDIVDDIVQTRQQPNDDESDDDDEPQQTTPTPTAKMAVKACQILTAFLESKDNTTALLNHLMPVTDFVTRAELVLKFQQLKITDYFSDIASTRDEHSE